MCLIQLPVSSVSNDLRECVEAAIKGLQRLGHPMTVWFNHSNDGPKYAFNLGSTYPKVYSYTLDQLVAWTTVN